MLFYIYTRLIKRNLIKTSQNFITKLWFYTLLPYVLAYSDLAVQFSFFRCFQLAKGITWCNFTDIFNQIFVLCGSIFQFNDFRHWFSTVWNTCCVISTRHLLHFDRGYDPSFNGAIILGNVCFIHIVSDTKICSTCCMFWFPSKMIVSSWTLKSLKGTNSRSSLVDID